MTYKVKSLARRLTMVGVLVMIVSLAAASAASATTKVPIWSSEGAHLPFGEKVAFSGESTNEMDLRWSSSGVSIQIQCDTLSTSGTVENSAYGKAGTLTTAGYLVFKGCMVLAPSACSVPSELNAEVKSGELTNTPYSNGGLKLNELSLTFQLTGCKAFQNVNWQVTGSPTGEAVGALPGEVIYPYGTAVKVSGSTGEMEFGLNVQENNGTPVEIVEDEINEPNTPGHRYWYTGGGMREGEGPETLVTSGSPLAIGGSGSSSIDLESVISGVAVEIACGGGSTTGSVENPASGKNGTASVSFGFTGCTVAKPAGKSCSIEGGAISTTTLAGALSGGGEWPLVKLTPAGETLAEFNVTGCTGSKALLALNGAYKLTGSLFAWTYLDPIITPVGTWSIPAESNGTTSGLKLRGQAASASGRVAAESGKGEAVTLD